MKYYPLVTVVIPCFNQGEFLKDAVNSILSQTFTDWECIIVNDGSTDATAEIARSFSDTNEKIRFLSQSNSGLSAARNQGIFNARGQYIVPLDADDYLSENFLEFAFNEIIKSKSIKFVFGILKNFGLTNVWGSKDVKFDFSVQLLCNQLHYAGMYRRADALSIGGDDEKMKLGYEDWEFYIRLLGCDCEVIQLQNIILYYRTKENSMYTMISSSNNKFITTNYIISKNIEYYNQKNVDLLRSIEDVQRQKENPAAYFSYIFVLRLMKKKLTRTFRNRFSIMIR